MSGFQKRPIVIALLVLLAAMGTCTGIGIWSESVSAANTRTVNYAVQTQGCIAANIDWDTPAGLHYDHAEFGSPVIWIESMTAPSAGRSTRLHARSILCTTGTVSCEISVGMYPNQVRLAYEMATGDRGVSCSAGIQ